MKVAAKGADLHVVVRGQGPVCLVLCNLGTTPSERQLPAQLDQAFTMVFTDLRGSGLSTGSPKDLSFDVLAEDLEAVRCALGVEQVAVLGHSIVSVLAMEHARRCPEHVSRLITVGAPPSGDMARLTAAADQYFAQHADAERREVLAGNLAKLPPDATPVMAMFAQTPKRFFDPRANPAVLFEGAQFKPEMLAHLLGPLTAGWQVAGDPRPLRVPMLLTHGRHDYVVPWTSWEPLLPSLPTARLQLFERSGHQPFLEEPDAFAAAMTAFCAGPSVRPLG